MKSAKKLMAVIAASAMLFASCSTSKTAFNTGSQKQFEVAQQLPAPASSRTEMQSAQADAAVIDNNASQVNAAATPAMAKKNASVFPTHKTSAVTARTQKAAVSTTTATKAEKVTAKNFGVISAKSIKAGAQVKGDRSWVVALVLAILTIVIMLPIARFYLGYYGTGIIQLLLLIVGIVTFIIIIGYLILLALWIWYIVDAIRIIMRGLEPKDGSYTD